MASEIKIPCFFYPHKTTNPNAYEYTGSTANNVFQIRGVAMDGDKDSKICFRTMTPVPASVNESPAGLLRIQWSTSATTGTLSLDTDAWELTPGTDTFNVSGNGTADENDTQSAHGTAYTPQNLDVSLASLAAGLIDGNYVFGTINRGGSSDGTDTISSRIIICTIHLLVDSA